MRYRPAVGGPREQHRVHVAVKRLKLAGQQPLAPGRLALTQPKLKPLGFKRAAQRVDHGWYS